MNPPPLSPLLRGSPGCDTPLTPRAANGALDPLPQFPLVTRRRSRLVGTSLQKIPTLQALPPPKILKKIIQNTTSKPETSQNVKKNPQNIKKIPQTIKKKCQNIITPKH